MSDLPNYYAFPVETTDKYVFGVESFRQIAAEIRRLHELHWEETERCYTNADLDPYYEQYFALEAARQFVLFTARDRDTGEIVGGLMYFLQKAMHIKTAMVAYENAFFVEKAHRKTGVGSQLLRYADNGLRALGCRYIGMSTKTPVGGPDLDKLLRAHGYRPVSNLYMKDLREAKSNVLPGTPEAA